MSKATRAIKNVLTSYSASEYEAFLASSDWHSLAAECANAAIETLFPNGVVVACRKWKTNADLIYDAYKLGYVTGRVYDVTPGEASGLWTRRLWAEDDQPIEGITEIEANWQRIDFCNLPFDDREWDTVLFDPPYKLNGNPNGLPELSQRYGVDVPAKWQARHWLMVDGFRECLRIASKYVLVKCQDQVVSGRVRWQTDMLKAAAEDRVISRHDLGTLSNIRVYPYDGCGQFQLVDRFDMIGHHIPQPMGPSERYPNGRKQKHAHARPSTLLVFERMTDASDS